MDFDASRRRRPRLWDTDWLVLRGLATTLADQLALTVGSGAKLLDYGCGSMPYRRLVEERGATYAGADFDNSDGIAIGADGQLPVPDGSHDAVLSVQVLEHVRDPGQYLAEARRVLKPGGILLLSTHGTWLYHPHPEDHRRWTRTGLVHEVERHGFKVEEVSAIGGPLATSTLIRLTGFAYVLRQLPLAGRPLAGALAVIMNMRAWLEDRITPGAIMRDNGCVYVIRCLRSDG